jgi:hypothetical protein
VSHGLFEQINTFAMATPWLLVVAVGWLLLRRPLTRLVGALARTRLWPVLVTDPVSQLS